MDTFAPIDLRFKFLLFSISPFLLSVSLLGIAFHATPAIISPSRRASLIFVLGYIFRTSIAIRFYCSPNSGRAKAGSFTDAFAAPQCASRSGVVPGCHAIFKARTQIADRKRSRPELELSLLSEVDRPSALCMHSRFSSVRTPLDQLPASVPPFAFSPRFEGSSCFRWCALKMVDEWAPWSEDLFQLNGTDPERRKIRFMPTGGKPETAARSNH
jgi:hypothetical protein